ncbi:MAG: type II toxin-antitoxin system VapC family toxin [Acidobacteriia bacterium]|nr:type II toxin-antitoxin system VapC family toxin [Terriglobia bacterium]
MARQLLDSDILIDFLRGRAAAWSLLADLQARGEAPLISTVSVAEILAGAQRGEEEATERLLSVLERIPVSEGIARAAGGFLRAYQRSHGLELGDALVAATALATGATLITRNTKHYPMPQIEVLRPY